MHQFSLLTFIHLQTQTHNSYWINGLFVLFILQSTSILYQSNIYYFCHLNLKFYRFAFLIWCLFRTVTAKRSAAMPKIIVILSMVHTQLCYLREIVKVSKLVCCASMKIFFSSCLLLLLLLLLPFYSVAFAFSLSLCLVFLSTTFWSMSQRTEVGNMFDNTANRTVSETNSKMLNTKIHLSSNCFLVMVFYRFAHESLEIGIESDFSLFSLNFSPSTGYKHQLQTSRFYRYTNMFIRI